MPFIGHGLRLAVLGCLFFLMPAFVSAAELPSVSQLTGWEYIWGASNEAAPAEVRASEVTARPGWKAIDFPLDFPDRNGRTVAYARVKLPEISGESLVIHTRLVDQAFHVYLDDRLIYTGGTTNSRLSAFQTHRVQLPKDSAGKTVLVRFESTILHIGPVTRIFNFGDKSALFNRMIRDDIDKLGLSTVFMALGLVIFLLFFRRKEQREYVAFAVFIMAMGFYIFARTEIKESLFGSSYVVWGLVEVFSLYVIPVGITYVIKVLLNPKRWNPLYWLWWIFLGFLAVAVVGAFFNPGFPAELLLFNQYLLTAGIIVIIPNILFALRKGKTEAVYVGAGFLIFSLFALADLFQELNIIPRFFFVTHWGMAILIAFIARALGDRIIQLYRDLKTYTRELEVKNVAFIQAQHESELLYKEIEVTQKEVIFRLSEVAEIRSKETGNHVRRVANYCKILAGAYGLTQQQIDLLKLAAPMHDIGKLGIPDTILNKPDKLSMDEFEVIKSHTVIGFEMLNKSERDIFKAASIVAYQHHERYDGFGYPLGLRENEIHIFGRITAVADVFDSLASDRCYKKAWPLEQILQLMEEEKGKHFDPDLVEVLFQNLDRFVDVRDRFTDETDRTDLGLSQILHS